MKLHETDDGLFCFLDEPEFSTLWYAFFRSKEAAEAAYRSHYKTRAELARVKAERDELHKFAISYDDRGHELESANAALARAKPADLVQEACGGRCGDPYCNLSTEGELMRTPAKHPDTERLDWLEASPSDRLAEVRRLLFLRCETARESIDAAMKEGRT